MAIRRPLIIDTGYVKELPIGDSLDYAETPVQFAVPVVATSGRNSIFTEDDEPSLVFDSNNDIVMCLVQEGDI